MNTTKKGDILENHLFNILSKQIEEDRFPYHRKKDMKIYAKKRYFSDKRDEDIIFDVVIEVAKPNRRPYLILIFECKNYNSTISVDNVEEFLMKTQGVIKHAGMVKPILVTNAKLQKSTENFLRNNGMGYIQLSDNQTDITDEDWIFRYSPSWYSTTNKQTDISALTALYTGNFPNLFTAAYLSNNYIGFSFYSFLTDFLKNTITHLNKCEAKSFKPIIPYLSDNELERLAENIRKDNHKLNMYFLNDLIEEEKLKTGLKVQFKYSKNPDMLGLISFQKNEIIIYLQDNTHRNTFTLAHELAHYYLKHGEFLKKEIMSNNHLNTNFKIDELRRMEYQANKLAAYLLLPKNLFMQCVLSLLHSLNIKNKGFGLLYLDNQKCNQQNFYNLTNLLKARFQVSREVIRIRLLELGILIEK